MTITSPLVGLWIWLGSCFLSLFRSPLVLCPLHALYQCIKRVPKSESDYDYLQQSPRVYIDVWSDDIMPCAFVVVPCSLTGDANPFFVDSRCTLKWRFRETYMESCSLSSIFISYHPNLHAADLHVVLCTKYVLLNLLSWHFSRRQFSYSFFVLFPIKEYSSWGESVLKR